VPPPTKFDFRAILRVLNAHDVDFIVIGGVCAALHGSPVATHDLDVVHRRNELNLSRILVALRELDASYRLHHKRLTPQISALEGPGHQLLTTEFGHFDILGSVGKDGLTYDDLLPHTEEMDLGEGLKIRVLDLPTLIELKTQAGQPKDMYNVLHLKEILRETRRRPPRA
jgi:predicted nucleotidyltransferase